jgi:hypothetical protein
MGGAPKKVKKAARKVTKGVGKVVENVIEKPVKKIGKETFDTLMGTTDEERRAMLYGDMPSPEAPEVTPEVTPEVVPDDNTILGRGRRRTKAKRSGAAGTLEEGYGITYAKASPKAPTGSA